jgi:hypothetical protein
VYHKTPTGWRYEAKGKQKVSPLHVVLIGSQKNEKPRIVSQQSKFSNKNNFCKNKTQAQGLKDDYHSRFVKVVVNPPTSAFCNYCCKNGHISLECQFKKSSNMANVAWVPKLKK